MKNQYDKSISWHDQLKKWKKDRQKVVALKGVGWNNAQIAKMLDISRERVRQILNKEGVSNHE